VKVEVKAVIMALPAASRTAVLTVTV